MFEQLLQRQLVDADRRGSHAATNVGDVEHLKQALNRAVLTERAVQNGKGDISVKQAVAGAKLKLVRSAEPAAFGVDLNLSQLVASSANPIGNCSAADQRDLAFRGSASRDNGDDHRGLPRERAPLAGGG